MLITNEIKYLKYPKLNGNSLHGAKVCFTVWSPVYRVLSNGKGDQARG